MGEFVALTLTLETTLAEFGQEVGQTDEGGRVFNDGFFEGGKVELAKQLGDAQSGDLLGGLVNLIVLIVANGLQSEFELGARFFETLLVLEPWLIGTSLPA